VLEEIRSANSVARTTDRNKEQQITITNSASQKLIEEQLNTLTEERKRIEENFFQLKKKVNQELVNDLQGPDFPTGGYVLEKEKLPSIYEKGEGTIYLRAKVQIVSPREIIAGKEIEGTEKSARSII
jgi:DNA gyrase/topoisomerase IV subunit A